MTTFKQAFDTNPISTLLDTDIFGASRSPHAAASDAAGIDWIALKENFQDLMASTLVAGTNIGLSYNDAGGTLTVSYTGAAPPATTDDLTEGVTNLYFTGERAQDAIGAMVDSTLVYVDGTPLLTRAALTGDVTASQGSNATTIANDVVSNAKLANMAEATLKGRASGAGTGDPTDLTATQAKTILSIAGLEVLTANRTYYVRTDGSDSNTGLTDSAGGAFLTIAKAVSAAFALVVPSGVTVTIKVGGSQSGARTFTEQVVVPGPLMGGGTLYFEGDTTTPANRIWACGTSQVCLDVLIGGSIQFGGFQFSATASSIALRTQGGRAVMTGNCTFSTGFSYHLNSTYAGVIITDGVSYTVSGGCAAHYYAAYGVISAIAGTVTISGTPAWSNSFARAFGSGANIQATATYSGSATGKRYEATANSVINVFGAGVNKFPGDAAGTTATGAQYL